MASALIVLVGATGCSGACVSSCRARPGSAEAIVDRGQIHPAGRSSSSTHSTTVVTLFAADTISLVHLLHALPEALIRRVDHGQTVLPTVIRYEIADAAIEKILARDPGWSEIRARQVTGNADPICSALRSSNPQLRDVTIEIARRVLTGAASPAVAVLADQSVTRGTHSSTRLRRMSIVPRHQWDEDSILRTACEVQLVLEFDASRLREWCGQVSFLRGTPSVTTISVREWKDDS